MALTQDIKNFALDLGYSKVGITTAEAFPEYISLLKKRNDSYSFYMNDPRQPLKGADPKCIMPTAKSIISVAYDYATRSFPELLTRMVARVYQSRIHNQPAHRINGARRQLLADFLVRNGCSIGQDIILPERMAAARAGIATYGRNNFAYVEGTGSFVVLNSFVIDAELDYDTQSMEVGCPEKCDACIKACPTGAIVEPLKLDPLRCIAFNNFITTVRPGVNSYIPCEIREKMGTHVHGCDLCQEVCPRNRERLGAKLPHDAFLVEVAKDFNLANMLNMTDEFYVCKVEPIMYNYIKEKKYLQRNAAIALGNLRDPAFIPDLERAMQDPEDVVRGYAAWALGRTGGDRSRSILETSLARETSELARKEIVSALEVV
jgi:epoxyqueuosine reductase